MCEGTEKEQGRVCNDSFKCEIEALRPWLVCVHGWTAKTTDKLSVVCEMLSHGQIP